MTKLAELTRLARRGMLDLFDHVNREKKGFEPTPAREPLPAQTLKARLRIPDDRAQVALGIS